MGNWLLLFLKKKGDFFVSEINKSPWPGPKGLIPVTSGKA